MSGTFVETFSVPGPGSTLTFERAASGRLVRLAAGTRVYFAEEENGEKTYGEGLGQVREVALKNGLARHVRTRGQSWIEEYLWDEIGRPLRVDGVEIERDEQRRVVGCGEWRYAYAGDDLVVIGTPEGVRHVTRGVDGRPVGVRNGHGPMPIRYGDDGARSDVAPLPATWHRDELGRLWTICDASGRVETTFLWNGFACIGRIDGDAGAPLAAFFSLDPSSTPVRVVTAAGMTRIPRDAFGESLLAHQRVPGLFGGAIHDGFVHLRSRALDPRCGSFDRRDPWHGRDDDPRRANGFEGPLPVEDPPCGPYAVCQYDPVGRTDPTGEASGFQVGRGFLSTILDATWSLQHNTAGLFALDWTLAFWFSVIFGIGQAIGGSDEKNQLAHYFDYEGLYNDRTGVWALRRGIFGLDRGFVYQHLTTVPAERFNALNASSVIVPVAKFEPSLYGTLLHVLPLDFPPLLLRGNRDFAIAGWSRSGGPAEAVAPGSPTPRFPLGGLHLNTPRDDIRGPLTCDVTELVPTGTPILGTVDEPRIATTVPFARELKAGQVVLLSDAAGALDIKTIAEVDDKHATREKGRRVRFTEPALHVATTGVRLRVLGESEALDPGRKSPAPKHIDIAGGDVKYKREHLLRFTQGGNVVGAGIVDGFEAQIVLDSGVPNDFTPPLEVRVVVAAGKTTKGTLDGIKLKTKPRPSQGDPIAVISGDKKVAAIVTKELGDEEVELDRTAAELAPLGAAVTWKPLSSGTKLGQSASLPAGATLSYTPETLRQAPKSGMVLLREEKRPRRSVVRRVSARNYDALVLAQDLPGNAADPYDIEMFPIKKPRIEKLTLQLDPRIKLAGAQAINAKALQVLQHSTPAVEAGAVTIAAAFNGEEATMGSVAGLEPSKYVVLTGAGGGPQPNVVKRITATIELDRQIAFTTAEPIDVIAVGVAGPVYDADAVDATHVVVHATSGGNVVQFPRFEKGAIVQAVFGGNTELYVADAVAGSTLTLKEGPAGAAIAAAARGTIQLVVPVKPIPTNETWRVGMDGKAVGAGATTNKITAAIWNEAHVSNGTLVALVQSQVTHAAKISVNPTFVVDLLVASAVGNAGDVTIPALSPNTTAVFTQSNEFVTLASVSGPGLVKGPNAVVVIPYGDGTVAQAKMPMTSGTVRVPVDAEKYEIDRRKSLVYHELTHTRQAQHWGPLWVGFFPLPALEGLFEGLTDIELPKFSPYLAATITIENGNRFLAIPDPGDVDFDDGTKVQVEQNGAHLITLGAKNGDRFLIEGGGELAAGEVQVRRLTDEGGWGTLRDVVFNVMSGLTVGGVTNYVAGSVWGGLLYTIFKFFDAIGHPIDRLTYFDATVPDPAKPAQIRVAKSGSDVLKLKPFDLVSVEAGTTSRRTNVTAADGDLVDLEDAPPTSGPDRALRIAYVDENDPMGSADSRLLAEIYGLGWLRSIFDPWRQIQFGLDPKPGSASDWLARFARYAFSSHSWSAVVPGYVFLDNIFKQRKKHQDDQHPNGNGHLSRTEQQAGDESGASLYSPLAKIRGGFEDNGHAKKKAKVGDIARYWHTPSWEHEQPFIDSAHLDSPGLGFARDDIEVMPEVGAETTGSPDLNRGARSQAARPGTFLPDAFYTKPNAADPEAATGLMGGLLPAPRGFIPPTPQLELSLGHYVAFTKPGTHRVTVRNTIPDAILAREAHDEERQTIFFDVTVSDVTVKVGTTVIAQKVPLEELKLFPGQQAHLKVEGSEGEWMLTAEQPGKVVSVAAGGRSLTVLSSIPGESETLEISRHYAIVDGKYADAVLATHGVNLPVPIHVPVRQFRAVVSDKFDLVGELKADAAPVASAKAGQTVFALLPIRIPAGENLTPSFAFPGVAAPNPAPVITAIPTPPDLAAFIGAGRIFKVDFPVDDPPEEPVTITFTIKVGAGAGVPITAKLDYLPHFRLTAASFDIAQNANADLASTEEIGKAFAYTGAPGVKAVVAANGKSINVRVAARANGGTRRIMALSKADPMKRALRTITVPAPPAAPVLKAEFDDISVLVPLPLRLKASIVDDPLVGKTLVESAPSDATSDITSITMVVKPGPDHVKVLLGQAILNPAAFPGDPPARRRTGDAAHYDLRVSGRICYPIVDGSPGVVAGATPLPVVVLLHGNHNAFEVAIAGLVPTGATATVTVSGVPKVVKVVNASSVVEVGNHLGYEYLQRELAENGIASISVDTNLANYKDCLIQSRADILLATLDEWRKLADAGGKYSGRLDFNRVGLMGHSRGGDAVVRAAKDNLTRTVRNPASPLLKDRYGITAVCLLAPSDFAGYLANVSSLTPADGVTALVVYGSLDNDISGRPDDFGGTSKPGGTGFRHYDRATCDKAMVFIRGACHNRFNTNWGIDQDLPRDHSELLDRDPDLSDAIFPDALNHQAASKFYIGGFFRWILSGEAQLQDRFTGDEVAAVPLTTSLQWSFGDELRRVDTFEQSPDNELGQKRETASYAHVIPFLDLEVDNKAQILHVPHQTRILDVNLLSSVSKPTALVEPVPAADWSVLRFLTFRIGRFFDLEKDPFVGGQPHLRVTLRDEAGKEATVAETEFFTATVPGKPFRKELPAYKLTFHRLETVRIPLSKFKGVDLHRVKRVSFEVDEKDKTHVFLDSLEVVRV